MLDKQGRIDRASHGARVLAVMRRQRDSKRNRGICLAYVWLSACRDLNKAQSLEAIVWLQAQGHGVNMPNDGTGPYLFLAKATGLTKQRIYAIVRDNLSVAGGVFP